MLFATLDPSVRKLQTAEKKDFLLVDTVGFIKKLPHDLVEAFKSTLEELKYADLLLHVVDGSSPYASEQIKVVEDLIDELGATEKPQFVVINKVDKTESYKENVGFLNKENIFYTSAREGTGLDVLKQSIIDFFTEKDVKYKLMLPYSEGGILSFLHEKGQVTKEEYTESGILVEGSIEEKYYKQSFKNYEA